MPSQIPYAVGAVVLLGIVLGGSKLRQSIGQAGSTYHFEWALYAAVLAALSLYAGHVIIALGLASLMVGELVFSQRGRLKRSSTNLLERNRLERERLGLDPTGRGDRTFRVGGRGRLVVMVTVAALLAFVELGGWSWLIVCMLAVVGVLVVAHRGLKRSRPSTGEPPANSPGRDATERAVQRPATDHATAARGADGRNYHGTLTGIAARFVRWLTTRLIHETSADARGYTGDPEPGRKEVD